MSERAKAKRDRWTEVGVMVTLLVVAGVVIYWSYSTNARRQRFSQTDVTFSGGFPYRKAQPVWLTSLSQGNAAEGQQIAIHGLHGVQACATCHGAGGQSAPDAPIPRLDIFSVSYIDKQLHDYQATTRKNDVMTPLANQLNTQQMASLAQYFGNLPKPAPPLDMNVGPTRGRILASIGDNALSVPACNNCHGPGGSGNGPFIPAITHQPSDYVASQLNEWRNHRRDNDIDGVMSAFAGRITKGDADAVSLYYSNVIGRSN
jgi:cytochrome c553